MIQTKRTWKQSEPKTSRPLRLKASKDWLAIEQEQSLHDLVTQVEKICVGFDDHKQDVFNLVQALKALFLYAQGEKESVEEYGRNFRSLWDTVEAFGGSL